MESRVGLFVLVDLHFALFVLLFIPNHFGLPNSRCTTTDLVRRAVDCALLWYVGRGWGCNAWSALSICGRQASQTTINSATTSAIQDRSVVHAPVLFILSFPRPLSAVVCPIPCLYFVENCCCEKRLGIMPVNQLYGIFL